MTEPLFGEKPFFGEVFSPFKSEISIDGEKFGQSDSTVKGITVGKKIIDNFPSYKNKELKFYWALEQFNFLFTKSLSQTHIPKFS